MVLVNTELGKKFFDSLDSIYMTETDIKTVVEKKQPHLFHPLKENFHQNEFWMDYVSYGWKYVAEKYAGCKKSTLAKQRIKRIVKKLMGRK